MANFYSNGLALAQCTLSQREKQDWLTTKIEIQYFPLKTIFELKKKKEIVCDENTPVS